MSNSIDKYYNERCNYNYYKKVTEILNSFTGTTSIIDIGARRTPVFENLDKSIYKTCLDIEPIEKYSDNINIITADFLRWTPDKEYDIVICLQVLEHLENPKEFAQKLFLVGKIVIISLPYMWRKGRCKDHIQDPVDEELIKKWTDKEPTISYIIEDKKLKRIICVYIP